MTQNRGVVVTKISMEEEGTDQRELFIDESIERVRVCAGGYWLWTRKLHYWTVGSDIYQNSTYIFFNIQTTCFDMNPLICNFQTPFCNICTLLFKKWASNFNLSPTSCSMNFKVYILKVGC